MQIKLFGHRCLVEFHRAKTASKIIIPDIAQNQDSHRTGIVRYIGDGRLKGKEEPARSLVKEGDLVMFQINHIMEATQKFVIEGKHYLNLLQEDLLARIDGDDMGVDNLTMLGDYVLLKHFMRERPGSTLFLPDAAMRQSAPDFIYFRCMKKGDRVTKAFAEGNEVVVNFGRLTPMFIIKRDATGIGENEEYCYTREDWVDGVVESNGDGQLDLIGQ